MRALLKGRFQRASVLKRRRQIEVKSRRVADVPLVQRLEKRDGRRLVVRREHAVHQQRDRWGVVRPQFQRCPQFALRLLRSVELKQQLAEIKAGSANFASDIIALEGELCGDLHQPR
jgi:hypothetical protein